MLHAPHFPCRRATRRVLPWLKAACSVFALWLLLGHTVTVQGETLSVWQALQARMATLSWLQMAPALLVAMAFKCLGIGCAILRWYQLLRGQALNCSTSFVVRTFMVGRFFGIFLPGTVGLDSYKALAVRRATGRLAAPVAATAVEKLFGLCGMALLYLVTVPWGSAILAARQGSILRATVPIALALVAGGMLAVAQPRFLVGALLAVAKHLPAAVAGPVQRLAVALGAYAGQPARLCAVLLLSFGVHVTTACVYVCTAVALQAPHLVPVQILFASSIQILATVVAPFAVAGEGVREVVHALLLAESLGLSNSILSAALGFWVAEAVPTCVGALLWWWRPADAGVKDAAGL